MELKRQREFLMQEKLLSFRDKVKVMTPDKEIIGYFEGKIIKIGNTYRLRDLQEVPLLTVHEKIISMRSTYKFYTGGEEDDNKLIGQLKRKLVAVKPSYWFENKDEKKVFTMKGNIWTLKYRILYEGDEVAEINKKLFKIKGTYGIKIKQDIDDDMVPLILGNQMIFHQIPK